MTQQPADHSDPVDLTAVSATLLATAQGAPARRAAQTVHGGDGQLRQTLIALVTGAELAEHGSPPEATLQVLTGKIRLQGDGRGWDLTTGNLVPIPPERHSVTATEDSVFLLTIRRAAAQH